MALFAQCAQCGKKKLALTLDGDGICPACQTENNTEQLLQDPPKVQIKKSVRIRYATSQFTCDYITGNPDYKSAVVSFEPAMYPGQFMINDEFYEANFPYVIDDGISSDFKYERISTGTWLFYAKIGEGQRLLQKLNETRSDCVLFSTKRHQRIRESLI